MHVPVIDLGSLDYASAFARQLECHAAVLADRDRPEEGGAEGGRAAPLGTLLLVEHDPPVITVSNRPTAQANLIASPELLARHGVTVARTDRGGDITYHGPGQLVAYPILDLNRLCLPLHDYIRLLEAAIVAVVSEFGLKTGIRPGATGVWVWPSDATPPRKIAAIGVRVRRWVTLHGLALNVTTNLSHFDLIVPCGLTGELAAGGVTSLGRELRAIGKTVPAMEQVKALLSDHLARLLAEHAARAPSPPA